jgi:predicted small secreted protein
MLRKLLVTAALFVSMGAVVGCNTIAGAGKDVERGGEKIQDAAKDTQKKM